MMVKASYASPFSEITHVHGETVTFEGHTVAELIAALTAQHGARFRETLLDLHSGKIHPGMLALLDGRPVDLGEELTDGNEVTFVMAIAGGAL